MSSDQYQMRIHGVLDVVLSPTMHASTKVKTNLRAARVGVCTQISVCYVLRSRFGERHCVTSVTPTRNH